MIINKSKGKLISNNISRAQAISEGISTRLSSTADNAKNQLERQASNTATDHDTKKIIRNTERVAAPLATIAMTTGAKQQIKHFQKLADEYIKKCEIGDDMTARLNEMGMSARTFDTNTDRFGVTRTERNANMNQSFSVTEEEVKRMGYKDGKRIKSFKKDHVEAVFKADGSGGGTIEITHLRGISEMKHVHVEAHRTASYNAMLLKRELIARQKRGESGEKIKTLAEKYNKNVKFAKEHKRLAFYGKQQNIMARRLASSPKKISRQMLRLAATPVESSESMRGIHLTQSCAYPVQTAVKTVVHLSVNIGWNAFIFAVNAGRITFELSKVKSLKMEEIKAAIRKGRTPFKINGHGYEISHKSYGSLKNETKRMISNGMDKILEKAGSKVGMGEYFQRRSEIMRTHAGVRKSAKTELKVLHKEWIDRGFEKAAPKTYNKYRAAKAKGKAVASKVKNSKVFSPAKGAAKLIKKAAEKIKNSAIAAAIQAIAAALGPIAAVIGGIILGLFIIMVLCCFVDGNEAAQKKNQAFTVSQSDGKAIMNSLEAQHQNMLDKINAIAAKYDTADVQYPNGSKENYKELFCAMQVQLEYDLSLTNDKYSINGDPTLTSIAAELYNKTHIITEEPYTFYYDDGATGTACHIHVDIQRNETLAYSIFEGKIPSDVFADEGSGIVPVGTCDTSNWMDVCLTVKTLIAQTQAQYNQSGWIWMEVNGKKYHVRTDCSGYVSACLQVYGATTGVFGTGILINDQKFPGFTYMKFPGWDNLQQGDILVRRFKGTDSDGKTYDAGHTEIFYANSGGQHLVFSNGSTAGIQSVYPRHDSVAAYDIIYRPTSAGQIEDSENSAIDAIAGEKKYLFRDWSRSFGENALLLASNMDDVEFNLTTGNEDGYDSAIKATVSSGEFAPLSWSGTGAGEGKSRIHYVAKGKKFTEASSLDYIRYICAQHGVCADYTFDNMIENIYNTAGAPYSPVVDDTLKRSGSGTSTDSTEDISDRPILQNPHAFDKGMDDLGNLQVGDIMFYVWDLGSWTNNYDNTDYNTWEVGSSKFYTALDHSIPMMYIGDGNFTYYAGAVGTINVSEMSLNRCLNKKIVRYVGFTVSPVYGSTPSFCGWTDNKIGELIVLQNGSQWTEGKIHLAPYGLSEEEEKELREMSNPKEMAEWNEIDANAERGSVPISPFDSKDIDYSFYHEGIFEGDVYTPTSIHTSTLMNEICKISIKYYDMYGILPSTAYCHMGAVSHFRSTEESLVYYNLFELYDEAGASVDKYTYTEDGDVSTSVKNYKKYSSYLAAYQDWAQYAKNSGYAIDTDFAEDFATQRDKYLAYNLIGSNTSSEMTNIYNGTIALPEYDKAAIDRKKAIDNVADTTKSINESEFSADKPSKDDYEAYCKLVSNLASYIEELDKILSDYDSATARTNSVLDAAIETWKSADKIAADAFTYYEEHKKEYIDHYACPGHLQPNGDFIQCGKTEECPIHTVVYQEWKEHAELPWEEPSYKNKYVE